MQLVHHPNGAPPESPESGSPAPESSEPSEGPSGEPSGEASGEPGHGSQVGDRGPPHQRGRLFPLSIRTWLALVMLLPLAVALGLASTVVFSQLSTRRHAESTHQASSTLDSLLQDRVAVYNEYVPSEALVAAHAYGISGAKLNKYLGIDAQASLIAARQKMDRLPAFEPGGAFAADHDTLVTLRRDVDGYQVSALELQTAFSKIASQIDARWLSTFDTMTAAGEASNSVTTKSREASLLSSFTAFTSGLDEESLQSGGSLETLLTTGSTDPAQVRSLIVANQEFDAAVRDFPGTLGPQASASWKALTDKPLNLTFAVEVATAVNTGLTQGPAPDGSTASLILIGRSEVAWASSLTGLVLASSADLRAATNLQAQAATRDLILAIVFMVALVLATMAALVTFSRAVRRPLSYFVAAVTSVRQGELELPRLDESGPREFSLAAGAFNEMSSTLRAVQEQAIALSEGNLDDPVLERLLPGRTGAAFQASLNKLQQSVRSGEVQRELLRELATRDSLTGLLNRGAALESLTLALAAVRRPQSDLALGLFFIDLDDLKQINDQHGHEAGDAAIKAVADALKSITRGGDVVARFGGDEFIVGSVGVRGSSAPERLGRRMVQRVANSKIDLHGTPLTIGCSVGAALSEPGDTSVDALIERADRALYLAKAAGRGQARWYGSD
jgi:diguanylate cyclase (GGDEF)-like protein